MYPITIKIEHTFCSRLMRQRLDKNIFVSHLFFTRKTTKLENTKIKIVFDKIIPKHRKYKILHNLTIKNNNSIHTII